MGISFYKNETLVLEVETDPNLNLLAHAQLEELHVGSECGGHGVCGKDRVRILNLKENKKNLSPPTENEKKHLTEEEIQTGIRLSCQCFPSQKQLDLKVEIFPKK